jgi:CRP/FNR family transcriptional regulator, cyclic AMP receptor protein
VRVLDELIGEIPAFAGLTREQLQLVAGCARNVGFARGERLFREDDSADRFFLVRRGRVALTTHLPARPAVVIETLEAGEIVGWSWLFPPYRWHFDAYAAEDVRAVAFDGACLRGKCEADHELGYRLMQRFAALIIDRLQHTRLRLLDLYGDG